MSESMEYIATGHELIHFHAECTLCRQVEIERDSEGTFLKQLHYP